MTAGPISIIFIAYLGDLDKPKYYVLKSVLNTWTTRETERQINSMLYERLMMRQRQGDRLGLLLHAYYSMRDAVGNYQ